MAGAVKKRGEMILAYFESANYTVGYFYGPDFDCFLAIFLQSHEILGRCDNFIC